MPLLIRRAFFLRATENIIACRPHPKCLQFIPQCSRDNRGRPLEAWPSSTGRYIGDCMPYLVHSVHCACSVTCRLPDLLYQLCIASGTGISHHSCFICHNANDRPITRPAASNHEGTMSAAASGLLGLHPRPCCLSGGACRLCGLSRSSRVTLRTYSKTSFRSVHLRATELPSFGSANSISRVPYIKQNAA